MATTLNSGSVCRPNPFSHAHGVSSQSKRWPEVTIGTRSMPSRPGHSRASSFSPCRSNWPSLAWAITAFGMPLPRISAVSARVSMPERPDRKSTRLNSSHDQKSYAVFCLKKKKKKKQKRNRQKEKKKRKKEKTEYNKN